MPENKVQFQIERLAFFSDAVIAIAITLLLLEVKIPDFHIAPSQEEIIEMVIEFGAVFVCFVTIGDLWMKHHTLFEHVNQINKGMVKMNLVFLFSIMILPLNISLSSKNIGDARAVIFFSNLFLCNTLYYFLVTSISGKGNSYISSDSRGIVNKIKRSSFITALIFLLATMISFIDAKYSFIPILGWPLKWAFSLFKKKK